MIFFSFQRDLMFENQRRGLKNFLGILSWNTPPPHVLNDTGEGNNKKFEVTKRMTSMNIWTRTRRNGTLHGAGCWQATTNANHGRNSYRMRGCTLLPSTSVVYHLWTGSPRVIYEWKRRMKWDRWWSWCYSYDGMLSSLESSLVYLLQEVWQRLDRCYSASAVDKRTSPRMVIYWTGWLVPRRRNTANCIPTGWLMDHAETVSEFQSRKLDLGSLTWRYLMLLDGSPICKAGEWILQDKTGVWQISNVTMIKIQKVLEFRPMMYPSSANGCPLDVGCFGVITLN